MNGDKMTSDEIYGSDKNLIHKLVDEFFLKYPVNTKRADCLLAEFSAILAIDVFLTGLYSNGYEIKKKKGGLNG